jgi:NADPH2:quinone reductase
MRAVQFHQFGGPEVLSVADLPKPQPAAGQVLVKVAAAGINFADTQMRQATYAMLPELPCVLGIEVAGTVEALGEGVIAFSPGQRVAAALFLAGGDGGYAEYVAVDQSAVIALPDGVSYADATALLMQGLTAHYIIASMDLAGKKVLVNAAAGGVGSILVQLAKNAGAALVAGAASSGKLDAVRSLGADAAVDYTADGWAEKAVEASGGTGFDYVLDSVGGAVMNASLAALGFGGQLVIYGALNLQDFALGPAEAAALMFGGKSIRGFALFTVMTPEGARAALAQMFAMLADGRMKLLPGAAFAFDDAADAHRAMQGRSSTGKLVLTP